jgi:SPP1 gp7 family putative phage head morphogenesis protein
LEWLDQQQEERLLELEVGPPMGGELWANVYVRSAYRKGLNDAYMQAKKNDFLPEEEMGIFVPTYAAQQFADSAFSTPLHADRVGIIYSRTYHNMQGITKATGQKVSNILALGMAEGRSPRELARTINKEISNIGIVRARALARTEVIHAHAEATLNAYEQFGALEVKLKAEWSTVGDRRTCPDCESMDGEVFDLKKAHGMIPLHPNCRCAWIPVDETDKPRK